MSLQQYGHGKHKPTDAQLEESARLFGLLAKASRLALLRALMDGPRTVTELIQITGMKQGNVSKHLGLLQQARFVSRERQGNFARYAIRDPRLYQLCELMCQRIEEDALERSQALRSKS